MLGLWNIAQGNDPIVATAIHDGHELRDEVAALTALSESERLREEDPYTGKWTEIATTRLVPCRSRFEVDLNRPRDKAVYVRPEDAWGLQLWHRPLNEDLVQRSLAEYDEFHEQARAILSDLVDRFGRVVVLDLHTYNHRRGGVDDPGADGDGNPEVNVGTGSLDRDFFGGLVDGFIEELNRYDFLGRQLDVRENVKFRGGHFSLWTHQTFPGKVCTLAIEFKKFFMDEWSGQIDPEPYEEIPCALASALPRLREELSALSSR